MSSGFGVIDDGYKTLGIPVAPQSTNVTASVDTTITAVRDQTSLTQTNIDTAVVASGANGTSEADQQAAIEANIKTVATALVASVIGQDASNRAITVAQALSTNPEVAAGTDINQLTQPMLTEAELAVQQAEAAAASVVGENERAIANAKATEARAALEQAKTEVKRAQETAASAPSDINNAANSFTESADGAAEGKTPAQQVAEKALASTSAGQVTGGGGGSGGFGLGSVLGIGGGILGGAGALGALGAIPGIPSLSIPGLGGLDIGKLLSSIKVPSLPEINLPGLPSIPNPMSLVQDALSKGAGALKSLIMPDMSGMAQKALAVAPPPPKMPQIPSPPTPPVPPIPNVAVPEPPIDLASSVPALPTDTYYGLSGELTSMMTETNADFEANVADAQGEALAAADEANAAAAESATTAQAETAAATSTAEGAASATTQVDASTQQAMTNAANSTSQMEGTATVVSKTDSMTVIKPPAGDIKIV